MYRYLLVLILLFSACSGKQKTGKSDEKKNKKISVTEKKVRKTVKFGKKTVKVKPSKDFSKAAEKYFKLLTDKKFKELSAHFDKRLKTYLPYPKLKSMWEQIEKNYGKFESSGKYVKTNIARYQKFSFPVKFSKKNLVLSIAINNEGEIASLLLTPDDKDYVYKLPDYAGDIKYKEIKLTVENGEYKLPGFLVRPEIKNKVPCVVMVHGSGPHDADETIGPNKPFKDLALGLAKFGVATFRYVKRTKQYSAKISMNYHDLTLEGVTVDDAVAAVKLIVKESDKYNLDSKAIFVLGHSLGGYAAPLIVSELKKSGVNPAGIIIMSGNTMKLPEIIMRQTAYLARLDGKVTETEKEHQKRIKKEFEALDKILKKENKNIDLKSKKLYFNLPVAFWLSLDRYSPVETLKKLIESDKKLKVAAFRGLRDYQISSEDFAGWKKAGKNITFKYYDKLNHLFMKGQGKPNPSEYMKAGHVDLKFIEDVADFVKK